MTISIPACSSDKPDKTDKPSRGYFGIGLSSDYSDNLYFHCSGRKWTIGISDWEKVDGKPSKICSVTVEDLKWGHNSGKINVRDNTSFLCAFYYNAGTD